MDEVFKGLADDSRRMLPDRLNERNGQTLTELCATGGSLNPECGGEEASTAIRHG